MGTGGLGRRTVFKSYIFLCFMVLSKKMLTCELFKNFVYVSIVVEHATPCGVAWRNLLVNHFIS